MDRLTMLRRQNDRNTKRKGKLDTMEGEGNNNLDLAAEVAKNLEAANARLQIRINSIDTSSTPNVSAMMFLNASMVLLRRR